MRALEIVRLHLARIGALNDIPVHGFVIKHPPPGPLLVATAAGGAVMIGDAAYTSDIYREVDDADLVAWRGQYSDREAWSESLHRLHEMHPHVVHFCHDTQVVHG